MSILVLRLTESNLPHWHWQAAAIFDVDTCFTLIKNIDNVYITEEHLRSQLVDLILLYSHLIKILSCHAYVFV